MTDKQIKAVTETTPDPERAEHNLVSFLEDNPSRADEIAVHARSAALLFSSSQFLANFSRTRPDILFQALRNLDTPLEREQLALRLRQRLAAPGEPSDRSAAASAHHAQMTAVRMFRMEEILKIALRDILRKADLVDVMLELSMLADVIIGQSLSFIRESMNEIYGAPGPDAFSVISLGKLGGEELNFSSDVDLIFVYGTEVGETSGVTTAQGVTKNRISNHEYYCKLGESFSRFLSFNTPAGFAYRVDLRLRPEGQRGDIALALRGYEMYYESWGRAWERAMLIRARPVAGEEHLGREFLEMIRPFVYRKYLDYSSIDEISRLKTRIDSTFKQGDIKRGYGGIREIEFFVQALQLIYGGREPLLRERSILKALHRLLQKSLIGHEDFSALSDNYRFLRTLEHRLQQLNDIQTHAVPSGKKELRVLGKKMGLQDDASFVRDLDRRRAKVRTIYDSLFSGRAAEQSVGGAFFDEEMSDAELREFLLAAGLKEPDRAARNIKAIKDSTYAFQTLRGRRLLEEILPVFVEAALKSSAPDTALNHLQSFAQLLSTNESYLEIFSRDKNLIPMIIRVFSQSAYLAKLLISRPRHLEMIGGEKSVTRSLSALRKEIYGAAAGGRSANDSVRLIKQTEEIRLGLLYLQKKIGAREVMRGLSKTAEAVLSVCMECVGGDAGDLLIAGFGKLGAREITFSSDLDIIFVSGGEPAAQATRAAEKVLRMLISYTKEGIAYHTDTRLRPEGSKGPLVASVESLGKYYAGSAAPWELQALLKARPVAGDPNTARSFLQMAADALASRGGEVTAGGIRKMRERIVKELSRESGGYDIKLGPGGIEDLEFMIQYLQLAGCHESPSLLVQSSLQALKRLKARGIISERDALFVEETYLFYRGVESLLRLRGDAVLKKGSDNMTTVAAYFGFTDPDDFNRRLNATREKALQIVEHYLK